IEAECLWVYPLTFDSCTVGTARLTRDTVGAVLIGSRSPQIRPRHGYEGNAALEGYDRFDGPAAQHVMHERTPVVQKRKHIDHRASKNLRAVEPGRSVVTTSVRIVTEDIRSSLTN